MLLRVPSAVAVQAGAASVVATCFLATAATSAVVTGFSVFHVALAEDLGWARAVAAGAFAVSSLVTGFSGPLVGFAVDRVGPRSVMVVGGVLTALGLAMAATVQQPWQYYLAIGILGALGVAALSTVPQNVVLAERFQARRGAAFGIAAAGAGVGTFVLVPLAQAIISHAGWRAGYVVFAAITLLVGMIPLLTVAASRRTSAIPIAAESTIPSPGPLRMRLHRALGGQQFESPVLLLLIALFCSGLQRTVMVVHFVPYLLTVGFAAAFAAATFATADLVRSISGTTMGYLSDRVGARVWYVLSCAVAAAAVVSLTFPFAKAAWAVSIIALVYGIGSGGLFPSSAAIQASVYPVRSRGRLFGLGTMSYGIGSSVGAWLGGYVFDHFQHYEYGLYAAATGLIAMGVFIWVATAHRDPGPSDSAAPSAISDAPG